MAHIQFACGMCGDRFDDIQEALTHCPPHEWEDCGPRYVNKVTSCCGGEVGESAYKEYPLGRADGNYILIPFPCCCDCGEELEE